MIPIIKIVIKGRKENLKKTLIIFEKKRFNNLKMIKENLYETLVCQEEDLELDENLDTDTAEDENTEETEENADEETEGDDLEME